MIILSKALLIDNENEETISGYNNQKHLHTNEGQVYFESVLYRTKLDGENRSRNAIEKQLKQINMKH